MATQEVASKYLAMEELSCFGLEVVESVLVQMDKMIRSTDSVSIIIQRRGAYNIVRPLIKPGALNRVEKNDRRLNELPEVIPGVTIVLDGGGPLALA